MICPQCNPPRRKRAATVEKPDPQLAAALFALVEYDQGQAFISDGMGVLTRAEIIKVARKALRHTEVTAEHLRSFLSRFE